jgi:hypothetical protein
MEITFKVNLLNPDLFATSLPYTSSLTAVHVANTASTWSPDRFNSNRVYKHGDEFTATDFDALYFKNVYTTGPGKVLDIV